MNVNHLRMLSRVVEQGSLNRAAEKMRVAQSTLTRQIQALEAEIGGRLLERTPAGVALTTTGHALLDGIGPVLQDFDRVVQHARGLARGKSAALRVGYLMSAAADFLTRALAELRRLHPEVKVMLLDLSPGEQITALHNGTIDIGLVGHAGAFLRREFHTRRLAVLPVVVAMAESNPLLKKRALSLADLKTELFVGAEEADLPGHNRWIEKACRRAGFRPRFVANAASLTDGLATVVSEGAVSLAPDFVVKQRIPGVVCRRLKNTDLGWEIYVAWQRGRTSEAVNAFLAALPSEAKKHGLVAAKTAS